MIFGKTTEEKEKIRIAIIQNIHDNGMKKFAWRPIKLANGQYIFLQKYHAFLDNRWDMDDLHRHSAWSVKHRFYTMNYTIQEALIVRLKK